MCICSSTISEGSCRLGGVALESCSALLMDTWKYRVPFSSHCCFQCTSEMSDTVPDISAGTQHTKLMVSFLHGAQRCFSK